MPDMEKELSTSFVDKDGKEYFTNTFGGQSSNNPDKGVFCMELVDTKDLIIDLDLEDEMPTISDGDLGVQVEYPDIYWYENFFEKYNEFYTADEKQTISEALAKFDDWEQKYGEEYDIDESFEYGSNPIFDEIADIYDKYGLVDLLDVGMEREAFEKISVYAEKLGLTPSNDIEKEMPQKAAEAEQKEQTERTEFYDSLYTPKIEGSFVDDREKMKDFYQLSEDEFLASYSYLTPAEYAATALDVDLTNVVFNAVVIEDKAEHSLAESCELFNEQAAQDDNDYLFENNYIYDWDRFKSTADNLKDSILNGQTSFLYDWIDKFDDKQSVFMDNLHDRLAALDQKLANSREIEKPQKAAEVEQPSVAETAKTNIVDQIRDEVTQDVACAMAINSTVSMMSEQFNAIKLLENVTEQFGLDKVSAVVAAQINKLQNSDLGSEITEWAKNISDKIPAQLGDAAVDMTKEQLTDFAKSVMKAEAVRDSVQEVGGMDELLEQLKKSREIANKVLSSENLKDRSAVEAVKLQNSISHAKTAFEQQNSTLPVLKGLSEMQLNKLNNLTTKQTELQNKNALLANKGKRLESRAEKLENTAVMLKALFQNKHIPKPLQAIINKTEQKAAVIRNEKIPKNNMRIDKNLGKMAKNDRKIEVAQCKVDKYQNLSKVIKSFALIDSAERKKQFTQGLDGLHNASLRSNQLKLAKCEEKIDKLSQKYMDADIFQKSDVMDKLKAQTDKKSSLNEKIEKLQKLEKPFAEQPETVVDKVMDVAKTEIEAQEETPDRMTAGKFADELCTSCVETAAEQPKLEQDKAVEIKLPSLTDEQRSQIYDNILSKMKNENVELPEYSYKNQEKIEQEMPNAKQMASKTFWREQGFNLNKNAKGVEIFAPKFDENNKPVYKFSERAGGEIDQRVFTKVKVYDISETDACDKALYALNAKGKEAKMSEKKSVLDDIKQIKSEQSKEQKSAPEKAQKKSHSKEAEI